MATPRYVTVAEFKTYNNIVTATYDAIINDMIVSAEKYIDAFTKRRYDSHTVTYYFNDFGKLVCSDFPLSNVVITYDGTTIDSSEYLVQEHGVIDHLSGNIYSGYQLIKVVATAGNVIANIDESIKNCVRILAKLELKDVEGVGKNLFMQGTNNHNQNSQSIERDYYLKLVNEKLESYRLWELEV